MHIPEFCYIALKVNYIISFRLITSYKVYAPENVDVHIYV